MIDNFGVLKYHLPETDHPCRETMHIILVILGSIITVLILVKQYKELKIDLSWFNFSQQRRKKAWLEKMNADRCSQSPVRWSPQDA